MRKVSLGLVVVVAVVLFLVAILSPSRKLNGRDIVECLMFALVSAYIAVVGLGLG